MLTIMGSIGILVMIAVLVYEHASVEFTLLTVFTEALSVGGVLYGVFIEDEKEKERKREHEHEHKREQYEMRVTHTSYYLDD